MLVIHNLHFEPVRMMKPMVARVCNAIKEFAKFNQCEAVVIKKSNNGVVLKALRKGLSSR